MRPLVLFALLAIASACTHTVTSPTSGGSNPGSTGSPDTSDSPDPAGDGSGAADDPTPDAAGVVGEYCGVDVGSPSLCTNSAGYLEIASAKTTVTGKFCNSYRTNCLALENGLWDGTTLTFDTSASDVGEVVWYLELESGDLVGQISTSDGTSDVRLYRLR